MKSLRNLILSTFIFVLTCSAKAQQFNPWMTDRTLYEYQEFSSKDNVDPRIHLSCEKDIIDGEYDRKTILWRLVNLTNDPVNVEIQIEYVLNCKKVRPSIIKTKRPLAPGIVNAIVNDSYIDTRQYGSGFNFVIKKECGDGIELREIKITSCKVTPVKSKDSGVVSEPVAINTVPQTAEDKVKEQADKEADKALLAESKKQADLEIKMRKEKEAQDLKAKKETEEKEKSDKKTQADKSSADKKAVQEQAKKDEAQAKQDKKLAEEKAKQEKKDAEAQAKKDKAEKAAQAEQEKKTQAEKTKADAQARKDTEAQNKKNASAGNKNKIEAPPQKETVAAKEDPTPIPEPKTETPQAPAQENTTPTAPDVSPDEPDRKSTV